MTVQVFDALNEPEIPPGGRKRILFDSDGYHVWIHGEWPAVNRNHMHKHTADEMFYCLRGACVFHLADGSQKRLGPGMLILIPKGELYRIEHVGDGYLALLGSRAEPDGMQRWDRDDRPAPQDTEEARRLAAERPRVDGRERTR